MFAAQLTGCACHFTTRQRISTAEKQRSKSRPRKSKWQLLRLLKIKNEFKKDAERANHISRAKYTKAK